jgi:hypothetical protein
MKAKSVLLGVAISLCFGAGVMFVLMGGMMQVKAACPGPMGTPCGNGDVNGDGRIDIADGIYIINWQFRDGRPPVAIECPQCPPCDSCCPPSAPPELTCQRSGTTVTLTWSNPIAYESLTLAKNGAPLMELPGTDTTYTDGDVAQGVTYTYSVSGTVESKTSAKTTCTITLCADCPPCDSCCPPPNLPATGQTRCYDAAGYTTHCTSADYPGQDGFYRKGCPTAGRFVYNWDGTVTDNCTGLMWQRKTADINGDGTIDTNDVIPWQSALKFCENLDFAGHSDWRLPNVRELQSIADYGQIDPAIDSIFYELMPKWYWSSTTRIDSADRAWFVSFTNGYVDVGRKLEGGAVRAVRTIQPGE